MRYVCLTRVLIPAQYGSSGTDWATGKDPGPGPTAPLSPAWSSPSDLRRPVSAICSGSGSRRRAGAGWGDARAVPSCTYGSICDTRLWTWPGKATAKSWQWETGQQFLTSVYCHFENCTDFLTNQYSLSGVGQAQWTQGDFCKGSCLVLATKPGATSWVLCTLLFWDAWKAEWRAMTRKYSEMWFNWTQGKAVVWLQLFSNDVSWLGKLNFQEILGLF